MSTETTHDVPMRITTSARRKLDTPLTTDRWRDYRPTSREDWLKLARVAPWAVAGIAIAVLLFFR
jgi:hypothetical protein